MSRRRHAPVTAGALARGCGAVLAKVMIAFLLSSAVVLLIVTGHRA